MFHRRRVHNIFDIELVVDPISFEIQLRRVKFVLREVVRHLALESYRRIVNDYDNLRVFILYRILTRRGGTTIRKRSKEAKA